LEVPLSGHDKKRLQQTTVTTTTQAQPAAPGAPDLAVLTPEEEKVLRMLHGLSEDGAHELKFALGADDELRARLALLEHHLITMFKADALNEELIEEVQIAKQSVLSHRPKG
jgi:hypothetical protein